MKVEAAVTAHPKFLRLKKMVGELAMEALVRLWGHCEGGQKGEFWRGADAEYIEVVGGWNGEPGKLFAALLTCRWIEKEGKGIRIHQWNEHNWRRVTNWKVGRAGGRPKVTQSEPTRNPVVNRRDTTGQTPLTDLTELTDMSTGNKNGGGGEGAIKESRTRFAALRELEKGLASRLEDLTAGERTELRRVRADLAALQKRQAAGDFT